ncbi:uncharacterized protein [Erythrolamprus reginae]|uniref:uncharacterized protein n=1 Tax=Erythrolamprus reginae TaxID=121349 RepID=UPI00396C7B6E
MRSRCLFRQTSNKVVQRGRRPWCSLRLARLVQDLGVHRRGWFLGSCWHRVSTAGTWQSWGSAGVVTEPRRLTSCENTFTLARARQKTRKTRGTSIYTVSPGNKRRLTALQDWRQNTAANEKQIRLDASSHGLNVDHKDKSGKSTKDYAMASGDSTFKNLVKKYSRHHSRKKRYRLGARPKNKEGVKMEGHTTATDFLVDWRSRAAASSTQPHVAGRDVV